VDSGFNAVWAGPLMQAGLLSERDRFFHFTVEYPEGSD